MKDPFQLNKYSELMGIGIEIAVAMALPVVIGVYLDNRFESTPWGVLGGAFLGLISMVLKLYKVAIISGTKKHKPTKSDIKS
jgi:F0F1-type ATP synthase assembly protein I